MDAAAVSAVSAWPLDDVLALEFHLHALMSVNCDALQVYAAALGARVVPEGARDRLEAHAEDHEQHVEDLFEALQLLDLDTVAPTEPSPLAESVGDRVEDAKRAEGALGILLAYEEFSRRIHGDELPHRAPPEVMDLLRRHGQDEARHVHALRDLVQEARAARRAA